MLQLFNQCKVALVFSDLLVCPMRERMCRSCDDREILALRKLGDYSTQPDDICLRLLDVTTDHRSDFNHRLMHLGLDLLTENHSPFVQNFVDARPEVARRWIDDLELFLDADGEVVVEAAWFISWAFLFESFWELHLQSYDCVVP